jgi:4-hydroxy-tetrahydrodipicolinate reductase
MPPAAPRCAWRRSSPRRSGDVVGEHTVSFGTLGERLELVHRAHNRDTYARGALRAARFIAGRPPGLYSMADVLGLV